MRNTSDREKLQQKWVDTDTIARLIGLQPQTLRRWRQEDRAAGRLWPQPGKGNLYWRMYGRAARYLVTEDLLTPVAEGAHDVRD
jgi:transposase-like protein